MVNAYAYAMSQVIPHRCALAGERGGREWGVVEWADA